MLILLEWFNNPRSKLSCFIPYFYVPYTEKGTMSALKAEIVSYLSSQSGVLPSMMKKYPFLGSRIVAWLIGEKPVLIIGGEPASGKSLLTGELVLRHRELIKIHPGLQTSLALISYDQIHSLVCKRLAEICKVEVQNFF